MSSEHVTNHCSTLVILKPDAVRRGLVGAITQRFEKKGLQLLGTKMLTPTETQLRMHYSDLCEKPYFPKIVESMTMGPAVFQIWCGLDCISVVRKLLGTTDPKSAAPGTIRGDYALDIGRNICHGSDSSESAAKEIDLWFTPEEIMQYVRDSRIYRE